MLRLMDELGTVAEIACYWRAHPVTVKRWYRACSLPRANLGKGYSIRWHHLMRWRSEGITKAATGDARCRTSSAPRIGSEGQPVSLLEVGILEQPFDGVPTMGVR